MRWDHLFADLEAQLDELERDDLMTEVIDRTQREQALIRLSDRLRAAGEATIEVRLLSGERLSGQVDAVGADWLTVSGRGGVVGDGLPLGVAVVPLAAVATVRGLPARGIAPEPAVVGRLDLGYAMRLLMREAVPVLVGLLGGGQAMGTIAAVGADYVELMPDGEGGPIMVPFTNVAVVRSRS